MQTTPRSGYKIERNMNIREYKKRYAICKDSNGKMLYAGDTVELSIPLEIKSKWESIVMWNMIDGAFVDPHPSHSAIGLNSHRLLRSFLQDGIKVKNDEVEWCNLAPSVVKVKSFHK